jgi:hypothetical protein
MFYSTGPWSHKIDRQIFYRETNTTYTKATFDCILFISDKFKSIHICREGATDTLTCNPEKILVLFAVYGRMRNDVCSEAPPPGFNDIKFSYSSLISWEIS